MPTTDAVLTGVQSHEIPQVWPFVEEMIEEALEARGDAWTLEDVAHCLGSGEMQLWLATSRGLGIEAAAITRIFVKDWPVCSMFAMTGKDPDRWLHLLPIIEEWARASGCRKSYIEGRLGWKRKLPDYHMKHVILEKDLMNA